jgi:hypothetical protein
MDVHDGAERTSSEAPIAEMDLQRVVSNSPVISGDNVILIDTKRLPSLVAFHEVGLWQSISREMLKVIGGSEQTTSTYLKQRQLAFIEIFNQPRGEAELRGVPLKGEDSKEYNELEIDDSLKKNEKESKDNKVEPILFAVRSAALAKSIMMPLSAIRHAWLDKYVSELPVVDVITFDPVHASEYITKPLYRGILILSNPDVKDELDGKMSAAEMRNLAPLYKGANENELTERVRSILIARGYKLKEGNVKNSAAGLIKPDVDPTVSGVSTSTITRKRPQKRR